MADITDNETTLWISYSSNIGFFFSPHLLDYFASEPCHSRPSQILNKEVPKIIMPVIEKKRTRDLPQINERIRFPKIRVIDTDGSQLGIITPQEAIQLAEEKELDLVLLSDKADPPVCRIMDYGKYKFEQEKKAREARKKQHTADVKEVKMRYKIEEHDYNVRVKQAERFLKDGDKVKATVMFSGREIQHSYLAE